VDRTVDRQLDRLLDRELVLVLRAVSDPSRLRIVGLIAEHGRTVEDLASLVRLTPRVVARHLDLLVAARLVEARPGPRPFTYTLRVDTLHEIGRSIAELEGAAEARQDAADLAAGRDPEETKVLRAFIAAGRLTSIPAQERKRSVVLRYLRDEVFTEDRGYPEKEVNQRLGLFHPDVASLRRYMVDGGLVTREAGVYRRVV
jgi:DNA-binding transcriptional ArsR family regulator